MDGVLVVYLGSVTIHPFASFERPNHLSETTALLGIWLEYPSIVWHVA